MTPASFTSDVAHALLISALLAFFFSETLGRFWNRYRAGLLGATIGVLLSIIPLPWQPAFYTRAILGDPGALGWLFYAYLLVHSVSPKLLLSDIEIRILSVTALIGGLLIYPASVGITGWPDIYNSGFSGYLPLVGSLVLAGWFLWRNLLLSAACMGFGFFLYSLDLHESANLWDCYFDVPTIFVSMWILAEWGWHHWRGNAPDIRSGTGD